MFTRLEFTCRTLLLARYYGSCFLLAPCFLLQVLNPIVSLQVYIVPTKLFKQTNVLEMLGFSYNIDEKKYIYVKPGTGGFCKTYSEEHGLERIVQFLKERRLVNLLYSLI